MKIVSREISNFIPGTEVWIVHSDLVCDDFRVCISAPFHPLDNDAKVGAIYGTDGALMAGMLTSITRACETQSELPQLFTVSICYPLGHTPSDMVMRNRDLSPNAHPAVDPMICRFAGSEEIVASGGGDDFLAFLVDELRPALAEAFPIDRDDATLCGASLGGAFTLHAMLSRPGAFQRYLAMCPAIWWDDKFVLRNARKAVTERAAPVARLYMCAGEFESAAHMRAMLDGVPAEWSDLILSEVREADVHGDMFDMEQLLARWGPDLTVRARVHPEESHGSVTAVGLSQGLRWLFGTLKR